jgi:NDP-sugar pyrophosphorylase family protein
MSNTIHLLIPMSGQGTRYRKAGYSQPKPLIPVSGTPMISRLLRNFPADWPTTFVMADNHKETLLPDVLKTLRPAGKLRYVTAHTKGPSFAVLEGLSEIPEDAPVMVSYCDYSMIWDFAQFERFVAESECDACLLSYRGFHAHYLSPVKYAYSRLNGERVKEVREKGSFTDDRENEYASCGGYYFRTAKLLKDAIQFQMEHKMELNGEYYTSLTVEALLQMKKDAHVRVFEIPGFFQWGTPEDLQTFEYWESCYRSYNRFTGTPMTVDQVLMPMAGMGSRFTALNPLPKPLLPINQRPMFLEALSSLPTGKKTVVVALEKVSQLLASIKSQQDIQFQYLTETPPGQALSTEAGLNKLAQDKEVLVSSCDHGIVLNPKLWKEFHENPQCDAAIFTVKGFPGAMRTPKSYAYVVPEPGTQTFPKVQRVSVKETVSDNPLADHLLVGTFWFKSTALLQQGIQKLKEKDIRVNNELYLDSILETFISQGLTVRIIPLDGYICWGDPDALAESLYWQEILTCRTIEKRNKFPGINNARI